MENPELTAFSNIFQVVLTAVVTALGAWFVFRGKQTEAGAAIDVAKISNEDDIVMAYSTLQAQLAIAAQNMVEPLNKQIESLQRQLDMAHEELKQLRDYVKNKSSEQEVLTKRVTALETENAVLRGKLEKAQNAEDRLRTRLEQIKESIKDTGELSSGVHKVDGDDNDGV